MRVQNAAADFGPVRVGVNKAGHNGLPGHVEHFGASWNGALCADALDAIVFDDDVRILQNFIAFHRHHGRAAQHDRALRSLPRNFQIDGDLL